MWASIWGATISHSGNPHLQGYSNSPSSEPPHLCFMGLNGQNPLLHWPRSHDLTRGGKVRNLDDPRLIRLCDCSTPHEVSSVSEPDHSYAAKLDCDTMLSRSSVLGFGIQDTIGQRWRCSFYKHFILVECPAARNLYQFLEFL